MKKKEPEECFMINRLLTAEELYKFIILCNFAGVETSYYVLGLDLKLQLPVSYYNCRLIPWHMPSHSFPGNTITFKEAVDIMKRKIYNNVHKSKT